MRLATGILRRCGGSPEGDSAWRSVQCDPHADGIQVRLFSAGAFPLGIEELDRAIFLAGTGLSEAPAPLVTPEDILLAKLHWFKSGGEVSEVQWRDIEGIVRGCAATLDRAYLERSAAKLAIRDLLDGALLDA